MKQVYLEPLGQHSDLVQFQQTEVLGVQTAFGADRLDEADFFEIG